MLWTRMFTESFLQFGRLPRKKKAKKNRKTTIYHSSIFDESYIWHMFTIWLWYSKLYCSKRCMMRANHFLILWILDLVFQLTIWMLQKICLPAQREIPYIFRFTYSLNLGLFVCSSHAAPRQWRSTNNCLTPFLHMECLTCSACLWDRPQALPPPSLLGHIQQL